MKEIEKPTVFVVRDGKIEDSTDPRHLERAAALERMEKDSDRAVGLVGGAFVDDELALCLRRHLLASSAEHRDRAKNLMHSSGALGAFSTRIDLAWLIGIYGKEAWKNLVRVKDVRNAFAHKVESHAFDNSEVQGLCANLRFVEKFLRKNGDHYELTFPPVNGAEVTWGYAPGFEPLETLRDRFVLSCVVLMTLLGNTALTGRVHEPAF